MRGFFGIGVEGISKPMNTGNLMRSAHAFGASFIFTVDAHYKVRQARSDTSKTPEQLPWYDWNSVADMVLPEKCKLVGVELVEEATVLPSFHHPLQAAYVLGRERGSLTPEMMARCDYLVKIPTRFCINVATCGAIIMYDRLKALELFAPRPLHEGGRSETLPAGRFGAPRRRR